MKLVDYLIIGIYLIVVLMVIGNMCADGADDYSDLKYSRYPSEIEITTWHYDEFQDRLISPPNQPELREWIDYIDWLLSRSSVPDEEIELQRLNQWERGVIRIYYKNVMFTPPVNYIPVISCGKIYDERYINNTKVYERSLIEIEQEKTFLDEYSWKKDECDFITIKAKYIGELR